MLYTCLVDEVHTYIVLCQQAGVILASFSAYLFKLGCLVCLLIVQWVDLLCVDCTAEREDCPLGWRWQTQT